MGEQIYYHVLTMLLADKDSRQHVHLIIKTNAAEIDGATAIEIYNRVNGTNLKNDSPEINHLFLAINMAPDDIADDPSILDKLCIPVKLTDDILFYREPGHALPISLIQKNQDGTIVAVDTVTVPNYLIDIDCNGTAIHLLFKQITRDAHKAGLFAYLNKTKAEDIDYWAFTRLPPAFLNKYGVTITPQDVYHVIEVQARDSVI